MEDRRYISHTKKEAALLAYVFIKVKVDTDAD